ncbi:hypothetical protein BDR06DRAFT_1012288 [Suillus hirtellus]|nr:hypothetical protein BDR06DRAFT_1012288 [Suillus hirtellus]
MNTSPHFNSLGADSNLSHTNTPANFVSAISSDHNGAVSQTQYDHPALFHFGDFEHFGPAEAYSRNNNSNFLEGPGQSRMHRPHTIYCDAEFPPSRTHDSFLYSAGPPHPIQPPSKPLIPSNEAVSDEELEQPLLPAAPTKALKWLSVSTTQPPKARPHCSYDSGYSYQLETCHSRGPPASPYHLHSPSQTRHRPSNHYYSPSHHSLPTHKYMSDAGPSGTSKAGTTNGLDALALLAADIVKKDNHGLK